MFPTGTLASSDIARLVFYLSALGALLLVGVILREKISLFKKIYLPASLIAGVIGVILGHNCLGLLPQEMTSTWGALPTSLIVIVFSTMLMTADSSEVGLLVGIVGGMIMINHAARHGYLSKKVHTERLALTSTTDFTPVDEKKANAYETVQSGVVESFAFPAALIGIAIILGYIIKWALGFWSTVSRCFRWRCSAASSSTVCSARSSCKSTSMRARCPEFPASALIFSSWRQSRPSIWMSSWITRCPCCSFPSLRWPACCFTSSDRFTTIESGDILVTAATATEPIIHGAEIKKGVYVAHLGDNEVDEELILRADKVVIDDWETDKHRMGDTMAYMFRDGKIDDSRIDASVSDLVAGRKSGRDNDDQLTYTCNVGLGLYDVAIAARVYQYAKENGIGQKLKLWDEPIMV